MGFDFSHTWLEWYPEEKKWYNDFFSKRYVYYRRYNHNLTDIECEADYELFVSNIVSIIAKGLFVKAHEMRRHYAFYEQHKKMAGGDLYYNDNANIRKFLANLQRATEIEFEIRPRVIQSELLHINDEFSTIMAVNIKWRDSAGKIRKDNGCNNGGRIEAYMHFHTLYLKLGWDDSKKIRTHLYEDDEMFQDYIQLLHEYFSPFVHNKYFRAGMGLKEFGYNCSELASIIWERIDGLLPSVFPIDQDKEKVAYIILELFQIPNDYSDSSGYSSLTSVARVESFAKYLTVTK